jgi:hypothetical protein
LTLCRVASAALVFACGAWAAPAAAEGYDGRTMRLSLDRGGVGTVDGATPPPSGVVDFAVGSDLVTGPLLLTGSNGTQVLFSARTTIEPSLTIGLPSDFAIYVRAPFAVYDLGADPQSQLTSSGPYPPSAALLVPLMRDPFTDSRLGLRAEAGLPIGDPASFRGDGGLTARFSAIYQGPVWDAQAIASGGLLLSPELTALNGTTQGGYSIFTGFALKFPREGKVTAITSVEGQVEVVGTNTSFGFAGGGLDFNMGSGTVRAMAGAQYHFDGTEPNGWFGLAFMERVTVVSAPDPNAPYPTKMGAR